MAGRQTTKRTRRNAANAAPPPSPGAEWADPDEFTAYWGETPEEAVLEAEREQAGRGKERIIGADEHFAALERGEEPNVKVRLYGDDELIAFITRLAEPRADL